MTERSQEWLKDSLRLLRPIAAMHYSGRINGAILTAQEVKLIHDILQDYGYWQDKEQQDD